MKNTMNWKSLGNILGDVLKERDKQNETWGEQNHPILPTDKFLGKRTPSEYFGIPYEGTARNSVEIKVELEELTFFDILLEEVCEAANADSVANLREELVQVAAVTMQMIESLDRNGK